MNVRLTSLGIWMGDLEARSLLIPGVCGFLINALPKHRRASRGRGGRAGSGQDLLEDLTWFSQVGWALSGVKRPDSRLCSGSGCRMNCRSEVLEVSVEGRQVEEAMLAVLHTVLLHRSTGKFHYKKEGTYSIGTVGIQDVDCDFIDFTYVRVSSEELDRALRKVVGEFKVGAWPSQLQAYLEYVLLHPGCVLGWLAFPGAESFLPGSKGQMCRELLGEVGSVCLGEHEYSSLGGGASWTPPPPHPLPPSSSEVPVSVVLASLAPQLSDDISHLFLSSLVVWAETL